MLKKVKRLFCRHKYITVRKIEPYCCISGEQLYKKCEKCGKVKPYIFREFEGPRYK